MENEEDDECSDDDEEDLKDKIDELVARACHWQEKAFFWEGEKE